MPPSYYFHALNPPWSQNIWGQLHRYWKWNKLSATYLEQSLFTHENQFILSTNCFFLNEQGRKTCFQYGLLFSQFLFHHLNSSSVFSQSIKIVGLSTSASAAVKSVSLIRAVTFHPQQKKTPPPLHTETIFFKIWGINSIIKNMCHKWGVQVYDMISIT